MLAVTTPLSGLAWNIESLIGFRVAAGVANGAATAAGTAMVLPACARLPGAISIPAWEPG